MDEGIVKTEDTAEAVGGTQTESKETETTMDTVAEGIDEQALPESAPAGVAWDKYGFAELSGKSEEEVANYFSFMNRRYGKQANELGELRNIATEYGKLKEQITGQPATKKEEEAVESLSEVELAMFAQEFNENPLSAMKKFLMPKMVESLRSDILKGVKEEFEPAMTAQVQGLAKEQEFQRFRDKHSDYPENHDVMKQLMAKEYLGDDVPYEETYKLAKLTKDEPSLFSDTCKLMQKGVPFDEAREFAFLKQNAATNADAKKELVRGEVKAVAGGLKKSGGKKAATTEPKIETMDDVTDYMNSL